MPPACAQVPGKLVNGRFQAVLSEPLPARKVRGSSLCGKQTDSTKRSVPSMMGCPSSDLRPPLVR